MEMVKAVFVSHEHSDHITGLSGISKKYQLPVYITPGTFHQSGLPLQKELTYSFSHAKRIRMGDLSVTPFRKSHDAADPYSFMISGSGIHVGVITDIGYPCKRVIKYFGQCHAAFLESNYCDDMLANGSYPAYLKKRISGDEGHLSNAQALDLFINYRSPLLQLLILSHLSKNNNRPQLVEKLFKPHAGNTKIIVASRYEPSPVFEIKNENLPVRVLKPKRTRQTHENQLSLF